MKINKLVCLHLLPIVIAVELEHNFRRVGRKLFGGYKITPKFCNATRKPAQEMGGLTICMFNHECVQRNGQVVGACMDGFLFGACCQLPAGSAGELIESDLMSANSPNNNLLNVRPTNTPRPFGSSTSSFSTSNAVSQITATLLSQSVMPTAEDNAVVQMGNDQHFSTVGVTHSSRPDTMLIQNELNKIESDDFKVATSPSTIIDRKTTMRIDDSTTSYGTDVDSPVVHISLSSSSPLYKPTSSKPYFKPKPSKPSDGDKYVLVPTIIHPVNPVKTNKTQENESSTKNPQQSTSTSRKPPSTSYVFSPSPTKRPSYKPQSTSRKPPSTSYVYSSTIPPRRPITKPSTTTSTKKKPSSTSSVNTKPVKTTKPTTTTYTRPATATKRPSTVAASPDAFVTTNKPLYSVYGSTNTKYPSSTVNTHLPGPSFSVSSTPGQFGNYPSPAPTLIVLGSYGGDGTESPVKKPDTYSTSIPNRKPPVTQLTINNHITQNIYSTSERPVVPTVLITPKPSISTATNSHYRPTTDFAPSPIEAETSSDELNNFPPVRNPNLNMSASLMDDSDVTTPDFIEDEALNKKVESFVNKIILSLQEPFEGLKDVVYNRNKTADVFGTSTTTTTTKKPIKKTGVTTKRPTSRPTSTNVRTTTKKPSTKPKPSTTSLTTKRPPSSPSKRTKRPTTTTESFIEQDETTISNDYRTQCGIRPLVKSGRIVGGKGATFGEFPWQVLVRESTWLGLFTKNKCGGVLISNKYVMTAAHCQPGFLASLVAVFGEFDISGDLESKRPISRNVKRVIVHRQYDAATFENDLALLELEQPVQFDAHIVPICLPRDNEDFTGRMATVTGWGRLKYGGGVPSVLQEVQVPIMENRICQEMFRTAGHSKVILESFLCAGYANGQKDSCEGDSGGPLVLQRPDGRFQLAGTVSHGIKCAAPYLPGVYMRTTYYKPWITSITGIQ